MMLVVTCLLRHDDTLSDVLTPSTYEEAVKSRHAARWRESMDIEIKDLLRHDTWELVEVKYLGLIR